MTEAHHGHDLSDQTWSLPEPHLPGRRGRWRGVARDNRRFLDVVLWILRTGAPWQYDKELYKRRNEIERLFHRLKGFRRIFSRFTGPMSCSSASLPSHSSSNSCVCVSRP